MKVEATQLQPVCSTDSTAAPRASSEPFQGGLAVVSVTVIRCLHDHPVRGVSYRQHGATLGSMAGQWFPTGRIIPIRPRQIPDFELKDDHHLGYCPKCKAATEYRRAVD